MSVRDQFWKWCAEATEQYAKCQDHRRIESILLKILTLVKENPGERNFFKDAFLTILQNPRKWSNLIVQFCMRDLHFPEVYEKAIELVNSHLEDDSAAQDVIRVYRPVWPLGLSFNYYKQKEPPLQFQKIEFGKGRYFYHRVRGIIRRFLKGS